jgi:hypothetical protein
LNLEYYLSANDWIKISIKFSGICVNCKKRINSGDYGYWSRISKSILHESCYDSLFLSFSDVDKLNNDDSTKGDVEGKDNNKSVILDGNRKSAGTSVVKNGDIDSIAKKREKKIKCFICDNYINFNNRFITSLLNISEKYASNSNIYYCYDCLENFSNVVMGDYRKKFMQQF